MMHAGSKMAASPFYYAVFWLAVQIVITGAFPTNPETDDRQVLTGHFVRIDPATGGHHNLHKDEIRSLAKNEDHFLRFYFDDNDKLSPLTMRVSQGSVWAKDSEVVVREGPDAMPVALTLDADCFLRGGLVGLEGAVHINTCGSMTVSIQTPHHLYDLEEHETQEGQGRTTFRVTRREQEEEEMAEELEGMRTDVMDRGSMEEEEEEEEVDNQNGTVRRKRSVVMPSVTVELAVFLDANYVKYQMEEAGRNTMRRLNDFIVAKWETIQNVFRDPRAIGARVRIELKKIEVWQTNPTGYPDNSVGVYDRLKWFCSNTPHANSFDLKMLYTRGVGGHQMGMGFKLGMCQNGVKCALVKSSTERVHIELHEMGHTFGFPHHPLISGCEDTPEGFMGWQKNLEFPPCYRPVLRGYLRQDQLRCLSEQNVF